jgi:hypothetical protein
LKSHIITQIQTFAFEISLKSEGTRSRRKHDNGETQMIHVVVGDQGPEPRLQFAL